MTGREFLKNVRAENFRLKLLEDRIAELNSNLYRVKGISYDKEHVDGGELSDIGDRISNLQLLITDAGAHWDKLIADKRLAMAIIFEIEDERYQTILEERYINMRTWDYIARRMGYELRNVFRLHGKALIVFDDLYQKRT